MSIVQLTVDKSKSKCNIQKTDKAKFDDFFFLPIAREYKFDF